MTQPNLPDQIRNDIFEEPRVERYVCAAGTKQIKKYLGNHRLGKCFAVLSDYALYCKGRCLVSRRDGKTKKRTVDYRLDLPVIESVKLVSRKPFWCISLCFFFLILAPLLLIVDRLTGYGEATVLTPKLDAVICLALSLIFLLVFYIRKKRLLRVKFQGGALAIDSADLPQREEQQLIRQLRQLMEQQNPTPSTVPQPSARAQYPQN